MQTSLSIVCIVLFLSPGGFDLWSVVVMDLSHRLDSKENCERAIEVLNGTMLQGQSLSFVLCSWNYSEKILLSIKAQLCTSSECGTFDLEGLVL